MEPPALTHPGPDREPCTSRHQARPTRTGPRKEVSQGDLPLADPPVCRHRQSSQAGQAPGPDRNNAPGICRQTARFDCANSVQCVTTLFMINDLNDLSTCSSTQNPHPLWTTLALTCSKSLQRNCKGRAAARPPAPQQKLSGPGCDSHQACSKRPCCHSGLGRPLRGRRAQGLPCRRMAAPTGPPLQAGRPHQRATDFTQDRQN